MVAHTHRRRRSGLSRRLLGIGVAATFALGMSSTVWAAGIVTSGELHPFAAGAGLDITGRAQIVRTSDGKTIAMVHVEGLAASTAYPAHVHQLSCGTSDADGHYKNDPAGPATPPNEIWPGFTTNAAGIGNGNATVDWIAGAAAVSIVVHAPGGAKIACADLG